MIRNNIDLHELVKEPWIINGGKYNIGSYNKSTVFLLPMLGFKIATDKLLRKYLINAFIDDCDLEHEFIRPLFLLFKVGDYLEKDWIDLQRKIKLRELKDLYLNDYYVGENNEKEHLVMFVFKTPEEYKDDYYHFKAGRYSKFSAPYKKFFTKEAISDNKIVESKLYGTIHKTATMKKYIMNEFGLDTKTVDEMEELWEIPKIQDEYYRIVK